MADNFLERKRRDYEQRKQDWLKKQKRCSLPSLILRKASEKFGDE